MSRLQKLLGVGKGYLERLPPVDVHKLLRIVLMNLPYIVIFYVGNKLAWLYQYCVGDSMIERLMVLILNFQMAFSRILPSMHRRKRSGCTDPFQYRTAFINLPYRRFPKVFV